MTIVASGEISLGVNATTTRSVACELERSGTSQICMDETQVRTMAARTTAGSAICMNDFYGKTSIPTTLGQVYRGGYYTGTWTSPTNYYLIVAPNATGCAQRLWKTTDTDTNNRADACCNCNNGYWNTYTYLTDGNHPAGNYAATRSIGGFSDWYLPSTNELKLLYDNKASMPTGEGYPGAGGMPDYWTSSESFTGTRAWMRTMSNGSQNFNYKSCYHFNGDKVRAVRRVPV